MKSNRPHGLISWVAGSDVYKENKLTEDLDKIKAKFQENGYMEASVGKPQVDQLTRRTILPQKTDHAPDRHPRQRGRPIHGRRMSTSRATRPFTTAYLRSLIKLKKGDIYNAKRPGEERRDDQRGVPERAAISTPRSCPSRASTPRTSGSAWFTT